MGTVHTALIAEKTGSYMGMSGDNSSNFKLGSKLLDEEDSAWWPLWCPERLCKHVYDPVFRFGSAPQACNEKVESAINYAQNGNYTGAYLDLGRNPYHSSLFRKILRKIRSDTIFTSLSCTASGTTGISMISPIMHRK